MGRPPSMTIEEFDPHLADLLVDQSLRTIARGSAKTVYWRCPDHLDDPNHIYPAKPYNKTSKNPTGCSICDGKYVVQSINDVATTHPDITHLFMDQSVATTYAAGSNKKFTFTCQNPDHKPWTAPISRLTYQGSGCPDCSGRRAVKGVNDLATTHPKLAAELADPSLATKLKAGSGYVTWKCTTNPNHGTWSASVSKRTSSNTGCPRCSGSIIVPGETDLATTHPWLVAELKDPTLATKISKGYDGSVEWVCNNTNPPHTWTASPTNRVKGVGCTYCTNKKVLIGLNDIATTNPELVPLLVDQDKAKTYTVGTKAKLEWKCFNNTNHVWLAEPYRFFSPSPPSCPECFKERRSAPEQHLVEIIQTLLPNTEIQTSVKGLLSNPLQELDIVIPSQNLAIEFNGLYWHSDQNLNDTNYHLKKSQDANKAGYKLLHIWEDDWIDKKDLLIRAIAHKLNAYQNLTQVLTNSSTTVADSIYARKLKPIQVDKTTARQFWIDNHLQGPVGSKYYFGLIDQNKTLRALLGVGYMNHGARTNPTPGIWDIQRFATHGKIPGGFSKLLHYATNELRSKGEQIHTWTSYSNDDMSDGGMYSATGFTIHKTQSPSYWYVGNLTAWKRVHRSNYMKQRFIDDPNLMYQEGWTELEAAHANKLYRIYDAGKTQWVKQV